MKKNKYLFLLFLIFIISCSQTEQLLYDTSFPLTNESAYSRSTQLSVKIPQGWFTTEDNDSKLIDLWLVEDNFSSQIAFKIISFHNFEESADLNSIVKYSKSLKKIELGKNYSEVIPDETFFINAIEFKCYQFYESNQLPSRFVIFKFNNKYYECIASFSPQAVKEKASPTVLFKIQNSVLKSLSIK
ncbi:MAG: hypothetical protein V1773_12865 [bacterium]